MTEWYIKEFSRLTNVSVRTLHHYEENGSIQWNNIIQLIEDYRMIKEIEKIW